MKGKKIDWKKILTAIAVIVVLYLLMSGKLSFLTGSDSLLPGTPEESAAASSEQGIIVVPSSSTAAPQHTTERVPTVPGTSAKPAQTTAAYVNYVFRNSKLLNEHFEKHGKEMGFANAKAYEKAASDVINNPDALTKTEKEDGDFVYYVETTNEFVILSKDGYIRTYFLPSAGKKYYDRQ